MITVLADISTKGNPAEGAILVAVILVIAVAAIYHFSSRARNVLNRQVTRSPKNRILRHLFGSKED